MLQQLQMPPGGQEPGLPAELFKDEAEKRVRVGLVVNEIVSVAELEADPEKVRSRIEELAKPYEQPEQIINFYYSNEQQLQQIEFAVLEDAVVEHVLAEAAVEVIESSYDDIVTGRAVEPEPDPEQTPPEGESADEQPPAQVDTSDEAADKE